MAMILRIEKFLEAILAHRQIGRDSNGRLSHATAFPNRELRETDTFCGFGAHFCNRGRLWRMSFHFFEEGLERPFFPFEMDLHAFFRV
jgi:hypothetical protein